MYRVRQEDLPYRGSSHDFVGADQGDVGISAFLLMGSPAAVPDRTGIPMTKFSSSAMAAAAMSSTARNSRRAREIF
jgi:hypothetical protein